MLPIAALLVLFVAPLAYALAGWMRSRRMPAPRVADVEMRGMSVYWPIAALSIAAVVLLAVFQLVLRPGVTFWPLRRFHAARWQARTVPPSGRKACLVSP